MFLRVQMPQCIRSAERDAMRSSWIAAGCGRIGRCGLAWSAWGQDAQKPGNQKPAYLDTSLPPEQRAADLVQRMTLEEKATQLVNQARAIPRLNVPAYDWWSEALHGVAVNGTTEFPEPIGLGATFDPADDSPDGHRHQHRRRASSTSRR